MESLVEHAAGDKGPLPASSLSYLNELYALGSFTNAEVKFRWHLLALTQREFVEVQSGRVTLLLISRKGSCSVPGICHLCGEDEVRATAV